jgi:hypothetical protein
LVFQGYFSFSAADHLTLKIGVIVWPILTGIESTFAAT